jgi:hypothetical protein
MGLGSWAEPEHSGAPGRLFVSFSASFVLSCARACARDPCSQGVAGRSISRADEAASAGGRGLEGSCPEIRHDAEADAGPTPRRPPVFYSSVFAQGT